MAKFNVENFLRQHRIPYVTSGANWSPNNIMIKCPWCLDDPSEHMGIHKNNGSYACWRNTQHRGKKPQRIIMALIGCNWDTANELIGKRSGSLNQFDKFAKDPKAYFKVKQEETQGTDKLILPSNFRPITRDGAGLRFYNYLRNRRGFTKKETLYVIDEYKLHYCISGYWSNRLIIPIYHGNKLVSWTGRHLGSSPVRYKSLSPKLEMAEQNDQPQAVMATTDTIFGYDKLLKFGGDTLFITEGPFDAIKLGTLGLSRRIRTTCIFTKTPTKIQIALLSHLQRKFHTINILLDRKEVASAMMLQAQLSHIQPYVKFLPQGVEDPGDMRRQHLDSIF